MMKILIAAFFIVLSLKDIRAEGGEGELHCNETTMMLKFNKTELDVRGRNYTLNFVGHTRDNCMVDNHKSISNIADGYIWISAKYDECGIDIFEGNHSVVYNQSVVITYGKNPDNQSIVFREEYDYYKLHCRKARNFTEELENDFINVTARATQSFTEIANATFDVDLHRFDKGFTTEDKSGTAALGEMFYFQLKLTTVRNDISVSPQNCYATKNGGGSRYFLIKDKCANDDDKTVNILTTPGDKKLFQWEMEAFRYFGSSDEVYIQCDVIVCTDDSRNVACKRCGAARKRRDLSTLTGNIEPSIDTKTVSVRSKVIVFVDGKGISSNAARSSSVFSGTQGTLIIILLAVVVVMVAVIVIKKLFFSTVTQRPTVVSMKTMEAGFDNKAIE